MSNLSSSTSTTYASDASGEPSSSTSSKDDSNDSQNRNLQRSGVNDSGFVSEQKRKTGANISPTSTSSDSGASVAMRSSSTSNSDSSSAKRGRKNPLPKRRLNATEEIIELQKSTQLLIPRAPFLRVVREILHDINPELLIQKQACEALQESSEMYLVQTFEDALLLAEHRRCVTVDAKDVKLVQRLRAPESRYSPIENNNDTNKIQAAGSDEEESDERD